MIMTEETRQELKLRNKFVIEQLENKYKIFNSFEIFKPYEPDYPNYIYKQQLEVYICKILNKYNSQAEVNSGLVELLTHNVTEEELLTAYTAKESI